MDKAQKLKYQNDIEKYLENKKVYELFQDLMKSLVVDKPESPLDYLITKLGQKEQRIFPTSPSHLSREESLHRWSSRF
jgi:adenylate kinase